MAGGAGILATHAVDPIGIGIYIGWNSISNRSRGGRRIWVDTVDLFRKEVEPRNAAICHDPDYAYDLHGLFDLTGGDDFYAGISHFGWR